jgi:PAS domain S-box-containing protein
VGDWLRWLFSSEFMPHGHCYFWRPGILWLEVVTNAAIGVAYLSISATLVALVRRARDLPFQWVYLAFGVFIVSCGLTHFMDVWVIWRPNYWFDGAVRAVTAVASVGTAILIFPLFPKVIAVSDAARTVRSRGLRLEQINAELTTLYEGAREALAEAIPQVVWTATPEGEIDYVNRRWIQHFGDRPAAGFRFDDVVCAEDLGAFHARWAASLESGAPLELECRLCDREGGRRWYLMRACRVSEKGRAVRWFGTATDIQEQRLAAEERERALAGAREAVRARDVFLAVAAHELRTPLTPLRLELESLQRAARGQRASRLTPEAIATRAGSMERHLTRLTGLVTDLLDVARIAGGKLEMVLGEVELGALVREVVARHAVEIARAGSAVSVKADAPVVGVWDRARLEQVVENLLTNALKYGRAQPIEIEVSAAGGRARLAVRDRGIGVPPESRERIFDQFERAASERHYGGLGLGLWLVREIVAALGGSVRVESEVGVGSTFTVELPLRSGPAA